MAQIEINHLTFAYPPGGSPALRDICLHIPENEFLVLCGPTGCGKSTLLRHFKRELWPHGRRSGVVLYDGVSLDQIDAEQSMRIGFVQQNPSTQIVTDMVWHELAFALENLALPNAIIRQRVAELACFFGIDGWFRRPVRELSGGQKQMLNLAAVMVTQPKVLILDEPTAQLDPIAAREFLEMVRRINWELGVTVILTEHRLEEVFSMADRVAVMGSGSIRIQGTPLEVGTALSEDPKDTVAKGLPTPLRIYREVAQGDRCPLTIRDGRLWLRSLIPADTASVQQERIAVRDGSGPVVVESKDLWFRYQRSGADVLRGLSVVLRSGEIHCILGGNGSGKTTLLSVLAGLNSPYRGRVLLGGKDSRRLSATQLYRGNLALLPQNPRALFSRDRVKKELHVVAEERMDDVESAHARVQELTSELGLEGLLDCHPYDLSAGEQQKVALAMMFLLNPRILLMDEPTKGLDAEAKEALGALLERLKQQGICIVMATHDVEFAALFADRCSLLFDGAIAAENPPQAFFAGNSFYTTAANRMARDVFPWAVTVKEVGGACRASLLVADPR